MFLFVYGTLCKNEPNHHLLEDAQLVSEQAWVHGSLYRGKSYYPLLTHSESELVYGELYNIDESTLNKIDKLEGYSPSDPSSLFTREKVKVTSEYFTNQAFTYFASPPLEKVEKIEHGDWKVEQQLQREKLYYFAFGSCMDQERFIQGKVDHHFRNVAGPAVLNGYQLAFGIHLEDGARADIRENQHEKVEGVLYHIEINALDYLYMREGVNNHHYRPTVVDVKCNGEILQVLTFTVLEKKEDIAVPLHYAKEIYRGASKYLSSAYVDRIVQTFTIDNPVKGFSAFISENDEKKRLL
ncbi:gamma-glutamylcyclotransferase [Halobacillus sp. Marseille-Q1614]|uniref:gamma-glutamylcyclotransferase n=1 Tax=Halobacillus sp. Marseille-Q1614 TaxID=2709134 RepID=UPI001570BB9A|nr:gamma-glutamylcyclotransferase family protein [Halobacillus sp. Marseille-Q1614]